MNRIIIAGNGFDLAHGLKTKYEDFINWYWGRWLKLLYSSTNQIEKDELFEIRAEYNSDCLSNYFYTSSTEQNVYKHIEKVREGGGLSYIVSPILERISQSIETKGWVDIEADYYAMLVERKGKKDELERLNKDFAVIEGLLIEYLNEIQQREVNEELCCEQIRNTIFAPVLKKDIAVSSISKWWSFVESRMKQKGQELTRMLTPYVDAQYMHIVHKDISDFIARNYERFIIHGKEPVRWPDYFFVPDRIMLLNFNYTTTADLYMPGSSRFIVNHIHGELDPQKLNNVIFGYGDESDDEYENLKKMNDNEYLRHIKTSRYLETTKYRDLLSFIESGPFQVVIMGHSCGLSDRTMLNTLFEHDNCVSIKPYYYVNEQGKDNYLDIVQNISRNFTNPKLMRDRVVNKTFCEPLPQVNKE